MKLLLALKKIIFQPGYLLIGFISYALIQSPALGADISTRSVNLEVVKIVRFLEFCEWNKGNLPAPVEGPLECVIVGSDPCNFKDRFSYVIENSEYNLNKRMIRVSSISSMEEGLRAAKSNPRIAIMILMQSESEKWHPNLFPEKGGLMIIGSGSAYLMRGVTLVSRPEKNGVKLSLNINKANAHGITIQSEALYLNRLLSREKKEISKFWTK